MKLANKVAVQGAGENVYLEFLYMVENEPSWPETVAQVEITSGAVTEMLEGFIDLNRGLHPHG